MLLMLYVDNIILTGNQPSQLLPFVHTQGKDFEISDLGPLSYFFIHEESFSHAGLHLSQ